MIYSFQPLNMKIYLFKILSLVLVFNVLKAQTPRITIDKAEVIPTLPNINDSINIWLQVTSNDYGGKIYDSISISGNTVFIHYCVRLSTQSAFRTLTDTFSIGYLPSGNYLLKVGAYKAFDTNSCRNNPVDSAIVTKSFTVSPNISISELKGEQFQFSIFPNPVSEHQQLELYLKETQAVELELLDLNGRVIQRIYHGKLTQGEHRFRTATFALRAGLYFYRLRIGEETRHLKMMRL